MTRDEYRREIGRRLRAERSYHGLSQAQVRDATGISTSKISRIETGAEGIELEEALALLGLYDVSLNELLDGVVPVGETPSETRASSKGRTRVQAA